VKRHADTQKAKVQEEADKILQKLVVKKYPKCECCGEPTICGHHFIEKSKSNILRYNLKNIIPVCQSCHTKFHNKFGFSFGTYNIIAETIKRRGKKWIDYIETTKRQTIKNDFIYIQAQKDALQKEYEQVDM
jgi:5-methylcytosine-specific restriction endonuclease McrA